MLTYADVCWRMLAGAEKLQRLRRKLVRRIIWAPLFDVRAWVNDWSTALLCIWELFAAAPHRHHQLHLDLDATTGGGRQVTLRGVGAELQEQQGGCMLLARGRGAFFNARQ